MPVHVVRRHRRAIRLTPFSDPTQSENLDTVTTSDCNSFPIDSLPDGTTRSNGISSTFAITPTHARPNSGNDQSTSSTFTTSTTTRSEISGTRSSADASTVTFTDTSCSTKITVMTFTTGITSSTATGRFPTSALPGANISALGTHTDSNNGGSLPTPTPGVATPSGGGSSDNDPQINSGRTRLSSGAIVAIAVALTFAFLAPAIFFCRKRSRTHRGQGTTGWIFQKRSRLYEGPTYPISRNSRRSLTTPPRRSTSRSFNQVAAIFSPTQMTGLQRLDDGGSSIAMETSSFRQPETRLSNDSERSTNSQHPLSSTYNDNTLPMPASPFSPSGTFAFPDSPITPSEDGSGSPSPSSNITHFMLRSAGTSSRFTNIIIPPIPPLPSSPPPVPNTPNIKFPNGNNPSDEPSG